MDRPKIGDKIFLYGQMLVDLDDFSDYSYNAVMGYMSVGGYAVSAQKTEIFSASLPGFLLDAACLTSETPFSTEDLVDVTDRLALRPPFPAGTKVWMPVTTV